MDVPLVHLESILVWMNVIMHAGLMDLHVVVVGMENVEINARMDIVVGLGHLVLLLLTLVLTVDVHQKHVLLL